MLLLGDDLIVSFLVRPISAVGLSAEIQDEDVLFRGGGSGGWIDASSTYISLWAFKRSSLPSTNDGVSLRNLSTKMSLPFD